MDLHRVLAVLVICLPVFALMALGRWLARRGFFTEDRRQFATALVYHLALPALIFNEVARQPFGSFFNRALLLWPLIAILLVAGLYLAVARLAGLRGARGAAFVFTAYWANVTYLGFPLALNAFGPRGLALAAVYNAFVMPAFIVLSLALIAAHGVGGTRGWGDRARMVFGNPVILAALGGILTSALAQGWRDADGGLKLGPGALAALGMVGSFLKLVGGMGLPLALLAIGAGLRLEHLREHAGRVALASLGKLALLPFVTWWLLGRCAPEAAHDVRAVAVLLAATPNAVASYVVARQLGAAEDYVAATLVVATVLATVSIPLWLYLIL